MPQISYYELIKILKEYGCEFIRHGKGSHEIWYSPITKKNFTISANTKGNGIFCKVLKDAGI